MYLEHNSLNLELKFTSSVIRSKAEFNSGHYRLKKEINELIRYCPVCQVWKDRNCHRLFIKICPAGCMMS